jgi:hypothetical protein
MSRHPSHAPAEKLYINLANRTSRRALPQAESQLFWRGHFHCLPGYPAARYAAPPTLEGNPIAPAFVRCTHRIEPRLGTPRVSRPSLKYTVTASNKHASRESPLHLFFANASVQGVSHE